MNAAAEAAAGAANCSKVVCLNSAQHATTLDACNKRETALGGPHVCRGSPALQIVMAWIGVVWPNAPQP